MSSVAIKVNTLNRLNKIRKGVVYESITTVIDELLQNCQRTFTVSNTKDSIIDVVCDNDTIVIRDNGNGCENAQDIFEFEKSGWDIQDAFGQGGSESIFQIADKIQIRSLDWGVKFDVDEILNSENLTLNVEPMEFLKGYEIILQGPKIQENIDMITQYINNTLQYYPYKCFINGTLIEYKDLQDIVGDNKCTFNNQLYSATLVTNRGWRDCEVYYEKRKVTDIWVHGVYGIIELKPGAVNLKAPDRKGIIQDAKKTKFENSLKEDAKTVYLNLVTHATPEDFDKFVDYIDYHLNEIDYVDYLPYYTNEHQLTSIKQKILNKEVPNQETVEKVTKLVEFALEAESKTKDQYIEGGCIGDYTAFTPAKLIDDSTIRPKIKKFKDEAVKYVNTVWVEDDHEIKKKHAEIIELVESYGIKIVYSKNKLYHKAFRFLGIPHITEIAQSSGSKYIVGTVVGGHYKDGIKLKAPSQDITKKEDRVLYILSLIESHYGLNDVFRIADVQEHICVESNEKVMVDTVCKVPVAPLSETGKIYLDRKSLQLGKIDLPASKAKVTKFDVLVIMLNIQTIAEGLSKLIYGTVKGTVEHYNRTSKLSKEIAMLLVTL